MSHADRGQRTSHSGTARRGIVLPVVLIACVIMAALIVTFHFMTSTDYKQVGRLIRNDEAAAIADMAFDEVFLSVGSLYGPSGPTLPSWASNLLSDLDGARAGAASSGKLAVTKGPIDFTSQVPATKQAISASGLVDVSSVKLTIGPFQRVSPLPASMLYQESAFGDANKDRFAWNLTGPLVVEVIVNPARGPFNFSQKYLRGQEMQVTDTTPPATEFALFAFMPPPLEDYALNDLQRGGNLTVNPLTKGRVALRGPLLVVPEDAPNDSGPPTAPSPPDPELGGANPPPSTLRPAPDWHYPDTVWTEKAGATAWATVPTPRCIMHPASGDPNNPLDAMLTQIAGYMPNLKSKLDPRRSANEHSQSTLITKPFQLTLSVPLLGTKTFNVPGKTKNLGQASFCVATDIDTNDPEYRTIDDDEAGYFPPGAYMYGPLLLGKQSFNIVPRAGVGFHGPMVSGANAANHQAYAPGTTVADGDSIQMEPIFSGGGGAGDSGVLGIYSVAKFDAITYSRWTVLDLIKWGVDHELKKLGGLVRTIADAIGVDTIAHMALSALGLDQYSGQTILIRRFKHDPGWTPSASDLAGGLSTGGLQTPFDAQQATIAPYGFYYGKDHFWKNVNGPSGSSYETAMMDALKTGALNNTPPFDDPMKVFETFIETNNPNGWQIADQAAQGVTLPTVGTDEANWICKDHTQQMLAGSAGKAAAGPADALRAILTAGVKGLRGISPLAGYRTQGAFGTDAAPAATGGTPPDNVTPGDFPNGFYPPQFSQWETIVNRTYPDMQTYLQAETQGGVLQLRGAVMIQKMDYPGTGGGGGATIPYKGRGIIVCVTDDPAKPATLDATMAKADNASMLILAHRVKRKIVEDGVANDTYPPLRLGPKFYGSVYSDTGVAPASGSTTQIFGNLVVGLLNKKVLPSSTAPAETLHVGYDDTYADMATGSRVNNWVLEMGGEVSSVEPGP